MYLSVKRQKGESQNCGHKKTKLVNFSEKKQLFLRPDTHTSLCVSEVRNVCFSENVAGFVFLHLPFFNLWPYYRRIRAPITKARIEC